MEREDLEMERYYGDGWYDGFLHAQGIVEKEDKFDCLEDYSEQEVLSLSERAEANSQIGSRKRWTKLAPTKQGFYWHWSGCADSAPLVIQVLYSGSRRECFVSVGQYGITKAIFCKEYGGWWASCVSPSLPQEQ